MYLLLAALLGFALSLVAPDEFDVTFTTSVTNHTTGLIKVSLRSYGFSLHLDARGKSVVSQRCGPFLHSPQGMDAPFVIFNCFSCLLLITVTMAFSE
jgi:hypothetical protein